MNLDELQSKFGIPGMVAFEKGENGLPRVTVTTSSATAEIYLHGAHVTRFQPLGAEPVLFMSGKSQFNDSKPIRGGVPLIFPWFGPRSGHPDSPIHGFARVTSWNVSSVTKVNPGSVIVKLSLESNDATRAIWPFDFSLEYYVAVGASLGLELRVRNTGTESFIMEEALHTYLAVGDVREVSVEGLSGVDYIDKVDGAKTKMQSPEPIKITGETDRVYFDTESTCMVKDSKLKRSIKIEKSGSLSTVVWNPWIAKAKAMADFGDEEWPGMICVETCNAAKNAVTLAAGATHRMQAGYSVV